jgi:hypothetical protein
MTVNIQHNGTDLDNIFALIITGQTAQTTTTNIQAGGTDIKARYAPLSVGTAASATDITVNGTDLNKSYAAKGTSSYVVTQNTPGSYTETIPTGVASVIIECWGGGGGGSPGHGSGCSEGPGISGGQGAYARSANTAVTPGDTIHYTVGSGGAEQANGTTSNVYSGTQTITTITCTFGQGSISYSSPGAGGTASGGSVNDNGTSQNVAGIVGLNSVSAGGGGAAGGLGGGSPGGTADNGRVTFNFYS